MRKIWILLIIMGTMVMPMSAEQKDTNKIPDFSNVERSKVPVEFTWKLDDIYADYKAWENDKVKFAGMVAQIEEKAKNWTGSAESMFAFLQFRDELFMIGERLFTFASHSSNSNLADPKYQQMKAEMQNLFVQTGSKFNFFRSDILNLGKEKFDEYVKAVPDLKVYTVEIDAILRVKEHVLEPDKEKILSLTGLFSNQSENAATLLNNVEIPRPELVLSDGSKQVLSYQKYSALRASKKREDREKNMHVFWANMSNFERTLATLLDSGIKGFYFNSLVRNYGSTLDAALYPNNIDKSVYHNLIKIVKSNLTPLHEYLKLKQELLGLKDFVYSDLYASSVKSMDKTFTFDEAENIVVNAMNPLGEKYTNVLKEAFANRWIDIYPNKDKESGAYSSGVYGVHPFVKLNYDGQYQSVSTLAHELGHSLHSYFSSATQPYATHNYPIFLAEIASTFNENLVMDYMLKTSDDDLFKLFILDEYFERLRSTIYRQTLFAEFELAMYEEVEKGGTLSPEWLNKKYLDLTREYYGHDKNVCKVDEYIQNEWSVIPHFFYNYYVYQYSTGIIASMALADMVNKDGKPAADRYLRFLSAGSSKYPLDTLKDAGVDLTNTKEMERAMVRAGELVEQMKQLVAKLKKEGKL
ncbi:MAG: oligoendopeptidase F [Acidobacteria bacterium]|nr:oligoendopeptidase F [Acidobacteriota bacterium]